MKKKEYKIFYRGWIMAWLNNKRNYVKESIYANYANTVYNHLIPILGDYKLNKINNNMLQEMLLNMYHIGRKDNTGWLADKTIRDIGTVVKLSFKSAMQEGLIDYINLDFRYPKINNRNKLLVYSKNEQKK